MIKQSTSVLLVEDDRDLAASIADYLALENIECDHAYHGQAGLLLAEENSYDVILLDLMLPKLDGLSVCIRLRDQGIDTPILMLTARDTLQDKLAGFNAGTDDFLVKPFAMEELIVRIHALSKRRSGQIRTLQVGTLHLDLMQQIAKREDQLLTLTPTSWTLLEILMRASPAVVSRQKIEQSLWPEGIPNSNSLKVHLYNLRQQVDKAFDVPMIHTIPNRGFCLQAAIADSNNGLRESADD